MSQEFWYCTRVLYQLMMSLHWLTILLTYTMRLFKMSESTQNTSVLVTIHFCWAWPVLPHHKEAKTKKIYCPIELQWNVLFNNKNKTVLHLIIDNGHAHDVDNIFSDAHHLLAIYNNILIPRNCIFQSIGSMELNHKLFNRINEVNDGQVINYKRTFSYYSI